jgi:hypothetical protein
MALLAAYRFLLKASPEAIEGLQRIETLRGSTVPLFSEERRLGPADLSGRSLAWYLHTPADEPLRRERHMPSRRITYRAAAEACVA